MKNSHFIFFFCILFSACGSQTKSQLSKEISFQEYFSFLGQNSISIDYLMENTRLKFLSQGAEPEYFATYKWSNPDSLTQYVIFSRGLADKITKITYSINQEDYEIILPKKFSDLKAQPGDKEHSDNFDRSDYIYEQDKSKGLYVFISLFENRIESKSYYSVTLTSITLPKNK